MNKTIRILIAIAFVLVVAIAARNNVAWAGSTAEPKQVVDLREGASPALDKPDPGTVKPPPAELTACKNGTYSVGGVSILEIKDLAPGYCLSAFLRNHAFAMGHIPDGAGDVLAHITFLRVFHHGKLVYELPDQDGVVQICYAIPPEKTVQIYFFDFYGPRFGERTGQPAWVPLETTIDGTRACAPAQTTGAYALFGH